MTYIPYNKLNTETFIKKSKEVFGDIYDYSSVVYVDINTKVIIICRKHGPFLQRPGIHLSKHGCKKCGAENNKKRFSRTTEEFINLANIKHNYFYDYSKTAYKSNREPVEVICPIHSSFFPLAGNHLKGHICKKCAVENAKQKTRYTREEIIALFRKKHSDTYNYDKMIYNGYHEDIIITCKIHGDFIQEPYSHLNSEGCPLCSGNIKARNTQEFIEASRKIHGDTFDYSNTVYIDSKHKVKIKCKIHGEFEQYPSPHMQGNGCENCGKESQKYSLEKHLENWRFLHNSFYDYSLVTEIKRNGFVIIICPKHGPFKQSVKSHSSGYGCHSCKKSIGETLIKTILDKCNISHIDEYNQFPGLLGIKGGKLRCDFYLPDYNTVIEFQGEQHYIPSGFGSKKDSIAWKNFLKNVNHDNIKKKYFKEHNINFIEIPYWEKENIESIILNNLKSIIKIF